MEIKDQNISLQKIILNKPSSYEVFEKYNLDYCCSGNKSLKETCLEKKIDINQIISEINSKKDKKEIDLKALSLTDLVNHIKNVHHTYIKSEIPKILNLLEKVVKVHGGEDLIKLQKVFKLLSDEISSHLRKEEEMLFPAILQLDEIGKIVNFACANKERDCRATIANPINQMEVEHKKAGELLAQIDEIIKKKDFKKCATLEVLYFKLTEFIKDLHIHIHKENYVLFPKTIEMENKV